jgi:hypothetical protein
MTASHATKRHPANGVTAGFPRPGEVLVTAYGDFDGAGFARLLADAYRVVERDTGKRPAGACLTFRDGVIEVRVAETPEVTP